MSAEELEKKLEEINKQMVFSKLVIEQADNYIAAKRSLSSATFTGNGDKRNSEMFSYQNADGYFSASGLIAY